MEIKIRLDIEASDIPIEGSFALGNDEWDREVAAAIKHRLEHDDQWAWCDVIVEARCTVDGEVFIARDTLGACSYKDTEDFKQSGYYGDMVGQAIDNMRDSMFATQKRATAAVQALVLLPTATKVFE